MIKTLNDIWVGHTLGPISPWGLQIVQSDDCLSYVVWNEVTREVIFVDPKEDNGSIYLHFMQNVKNYNCLGVFDTHTHADHISYASKLSKECDVPLFMHELSSCKQVDLRISRLTKLSFHAGKILFIPTPGHTPDSMCILWGPFVFTGDTVLFNDVGRDDLPGGDPIAHYDSLILLKKKLNPSAMILPGHDAKGGRASLWGDQLKSNHSLIQSRDEFIKEALEFDGPAPIHFKKSLFENMK